MKKTSGDFLISRDYKKTVTQHIIDILCFILPVLCAIAGCFVSPLIWKCFTEKETPEYFKFIISIIFFLIPAIIIFVKTRNANPVMKIRVSTKSE